MLVQGRYMVTFLLAVGASLVVNVTLSESDEPANGKAAVCTASDGDLRAMPSSLDASTAQALVQLRQEIQCLISKQTEAINTMPQRLLAEAAKENIKQALLQELTTQISALRRNLQEQIDALKNGPPAAATSEKAKTP